jgi:hypothetical protein
MSSSTPERVKTLVMVLKLVGVAIGIWLFVIWSGVILVILTVRDGWVITGVIITWVMTLIYALAIVFSTIIEVDEGGGQLMFDMWEELKARRLRDKMYKETVRAHIKANK